jgi:hypothetical protein
VATLPSSTDHQDELECKVLNTHQNPSRIAATPWKLEIRDLAVSNLQGQFLKRHPIKMSGQSEDIHTLCMTVSRDARNLSKTATPTRKDFGPWRQSQRPTGTKSLVVARRRSEGYHPESHQPQPSTRALYASFFLDFPSACIPPFCSCHFSEFFDPRRIRKSFFLLRNLAVQPASARVNSSTHPPPPRSKQL